MKKAIIFSGFVFTLISCGESGNNSTTNSDTGVSPGAIDEETQHATGVTNQNVISTDTSAFNVQRQSDSTKESSHNH